MAIEIVNWLEIPVVDMDRARKFYENVFEFKLVDLNVGDEIYPCFPNKEGEGFSGALVQYPFTRPGRVGPLVYLNSYGKMDSMLEKISFSGGKIIEPQKGNCSWFWIFRFIRRY